MLIDRSKIVGVKAFIQYYFSMEYKREKLLKIARPGPLRDFLAVPFPAIEQLLYDTHILSVDFETTGFDANKDQILSIGFVDLQDGKIPLATKYHNVINTQHELAAENVIVHSITDQHQQQGIDLAQAVEDLLAALAGKVMLVHYAQIERTFLQKACLQLYGISPVFPMIDTLMLAKRRKDKSLVSYDPSQLRLHHLRKEHHLPAHFAHHALNDAVATAELFLAEVALQANPKKALLNSYLL
ncbi:exonuclease domain-containing protein [Gammaproteobacteria bacterium AS21]|jgi:DNA polymerase-3 subunit epsilon